MGRCALPVVASYYASRLLRQPFPAIADLATESKQISGHYWVVPPPLMYQSEHLRRILGGDHTPEILIRDHFLRQRIELRPSVAHTVPHAWLVDGSVYQGKMLRIELRNRFAARSRLRAMSVLPEAPRSYTSSAPV
jgi:hypothetical protein